MRPTKAQLPQNLQRLELFCRLPAARCRPGGDCDRPAFEDKLIYGLTLMVIILGGCAEQPRVMVTTDAAKLDSGQRAMIKAGDNVSLHIIDGQILDQVTAIWVTPGYHTLSVGFNRMLSAGLNKYSGPTSSVSIQDVDLPVALIAGHTYHMESHFGVRSTKAFDFSWKPSLEDDAGPTNDPPREMKYALEHANVEAVYRLAQTHPELCNERTDAGRTPLCLAAECGHKELVALLLAKGADVNPPSYNGEPPLYLAAQHGQRDITALMLAHGAAVNGINALSITPLHEAVEVGQKGVAELLLSKGGNPNAKNYNGATPLHTAAARGDREIVDLLMANGADVNARDNYGKTPLKNAILFHRHDIATLLRARGAKE